MDNDDLNLTANSDFRYITPYYENQSNYDDYWYTNNSHPETKLLKMMITLYSIIVLLGIIGNGLVIWIAGFRMKKTISAVWFLNLAIADFLCCASLILRILEWVDLIIYGKYLVTYCIANIILFNLNVSASVLLLTAMSIDRCVSVLWPFWAKVHRTHKLVRITAAIIWVMSLLLTGLVFYIYGLYFWEFSEWCAPGYFYTFNYFHDILWTTQLLRFVIMFVIPFLIILISYVIIFRKLLKSKRPQRSRRPYRIITAVILCFFLCWLPYYIWLLIPIYNIQHIQLYQFHIVNAIIVNLACLNSCLNPIIYVLLGHGVKHGFFRSIPKRLEKALSEHPNDQCEEQEDCGPLRRKIV